MISVEPNQEATDVSAELREAAWGWWLALLIGVISIIAGIIVIAKPSNSLATLAVIFGIFIWSTASSSSSRR